MTRVDAVTSRDGKQWALLIAKGCLLLWLAYLLIAPTIGFGWIDSWHNEQRAVQVVLLSATAVSFAALIVAAPVSFLTLKRTRTPIALFLGIGVISAARAAQPLAGLAEVCLVALLFCLTALTAAVTQSEPALAARWARYSALLLATAYVIAVFVRLAAALNLGRGIDLDVLILGYANPRFPSAFHLILIPFIASVCLDKSERQWVRIAAAGALPLLWAINWGLGTRGIWFGYLIGLPVAAVLVGWSQVKKFAGLLGATALAGIAAFELFQFVYVAETTGVPTTPPTSNLSLTLREVLWHVSWQAIKSAPILGIGPMHFLHFDTHVGGHPHNWFLQIAAEWGLIAAFVSVLCLFRLGKGIRDVGSARDCVAPTIAASAALALGLVDGNLVMPISQSASFITLGLVLGCVHGCKRTDPPRLPTWVAVAYSAVAVIAASVLVSFASSSLPNQKSEVSRFRNTHPGAWLVPRFWEQGSLR